MQGVRVWRLQLERYRMGGLGAVFVYGYGAVPKPNIALLLNKCAATTKSRLIRLHY